MWRQAYEDFDLFFGLCLIWTHAGREVEHSCSIEFEGKDVMKKEHGRPSWYYDEEVIATLVSNSEHRSTIGGMWEEIGKLQFDFLRSQGLKPSSRMIDIGCGCLRGGVRFVDFLEPGNYFGIDISQALLDAGYDVELKAKGLQDKLPRGQLVRDAEFQFSRFPTRFQFALAQSLFTHLTANHLQVCLARLAPSMEPDGALFVTFFLVPDHHPFGQSFKHPHGITSFDDRDPYHYRSWQIHNFALGLPWSVEIIGEWDHPRDQQMVLFRPIAIESAARMSGRSA
jgi:hypothetical protein